MGASTINLNKLEICILTILLQWNRKPIVYSILHIPYVVRTNIRNVNWILFCCNRKAFALSTRDLQIIYKTSDLCICIFACINFIGIDTYMVPDSCTVDFVSLSYGPIKMNFIVWIPHSNSFLAKFPISIYIFQII